MQFNIIARFFPFVKGFSIFFSKIFLYIDISSLLRRKCTKESEISVENFSKIILQNLLHFGKVCGMILEYMGYLASAPSQAREHGAPHIKIYMEVYELAEH